MTTKQIDQVLDDLLRKRNPHYGIKQLKQEDITFALRLLRKSIRLEYDYAANLCRDPDEHSKIESGEYKFSFPVNIFMKRHKVMKTGH